jgi:uncharacterized membrane protein YeaQ/YmgE (transglycosylase-associated protein family)
MKRSKQYLSSEDILAAAEGSLGSTVSKAVKDYLDGHDLDTAQTLRHAPTDTEAAELVRVLRRGRVVDVLAIAASATLGVVAGALSQKIINNATVSGVPTATVLGVVPAVAGLAAPVGLRGRAALTTGGVSYIAGAVLYSMMVPE